MLQYGGGMKKYSSTRLMYLLFCVPALIEACPFTFINTGKKSLIVADMYENAQIIAPGEQVVIKAPMKGDVQFQLEIEHTNAHAVLTIYEESAVPGHYTSAFRFQEVTCGKGSVVKSSDLVQMAEKERVGRFSVVNLSKKIH
jgi:hypothetical protein